VGFTPSFTTRSFLIKRARQSELVTAWYTGAWWLWLLRPLEILFRCLVALRKGLYQQGILASYRPVKPVVVVGNITLGGTGKTPVVIALVEALQALGIQPGVVSRGYGGSAARYPYVVTDTSTVADCGDEPLLIYRRTGCPCVVAPSRPDAVCTLLEQYAIDVVLSDDGLQHYALCRDLEVAIVDAQAGYGNGFCLPAGPLREPVSRLQSVDYVLSRGSDDPACGVRYEPDCLVNLATGEERAASPESIGKSVYAVAGIGQPAQFFRTMEALGFQLEQQVFPDHYAYRQADFSELGDKPILMTEKDAVKCKEFASDNAWYLRINACLPQALTEAVVALARR
jgi:tetraacyldisaccharide 4'-kinase